jgi:YaiO family outer membrane protein
MHSRAFSFPVAMLLICASQAICAEPLDVGKSAAIETLRARMEANPSDTGLMRELAAAQAAGGRYAEALETIERAQSLAPLDNDIALARARILLWAGRRADAEAQAGIVRARAPDYPDLDALDAALTASGKERPKRSGISVAVGVAEVDLNAGQSQSWETLAVSGFADIDSRTSVEGRLEHERRGANDTRLSLLATHARAASEFRIGASYTPNADFKERWGVQAGADFRIHSNLTLLSDIRYADYANISVWSVVPGVRIHNEDQSQSLAIRLIAINPSDSGTRVGVSARYDGDLSRGFRLFGGLASYPDTEAGVTRQLRSAFGGASVTLTDDVSMIATAEYDRREQSYTRKAINLALIFRLGN